MLGLRVSTPSSRARASPPTPSPTAAHSGSPLFSALGEFLPKNCRQVEAPPPRPQFPAPLRLPPSGLVPAGVWPLPAVQVSLLVPPETTSHSPSLFGCLVILIPSLHLIGDPAPASPLLPLL